MSVELLSRIAEQLGYPGVFISSLLGSVVPFLPLPYLFIVILLSDVLDPFMLGLTAGIGGSLGKVTSYLLGRGGYKLFKPDTKRKMEALRELLGKYGDLGVFVFALTPLPDDIYLIPIGMIRFSFWRFLLANTAGKVILSVFVAYLGKIYFDYARIFLGEAQFFSVIVAISFMVIVTALLLRVDWELTLRIARKDGWRGVLMNLSAILSLSKEES